MREFRQDHSFPLFVTLIVVAFLLMTFDLRSDGEGITGSLRSGANQVVQPVETVAQAVVNPMADFIDGLSNIAGLRAENAALRAELAEAEGEIAAVEDKLERLDVLENLLDLPIDVQAYSRTLANVTGRAGTFDLSFRIDKGLDAGVLAGHPVLDDNGYVVGRVLESWDGGATVVPITGDIDAVTVTVGGQDGILRAVPGASDMELDREMSLDVFVRATAVSEGDRVVTSRFSQAFPPGLPVGVVMADASPDGQNLTTRVEPFMDLRSLRAVVVVVWPADPAASTADDVPLTPEPSVPDETTDATASDGTPTTTVSGG
jgi:rod shape-determining protein MreC